MTMRTHATLMVAFLLGGAWATPSRAQDTKVPLIVKDVLSNPIR